MKTSFITTASLSDKEFLGSVTRKGQITIPAPLRRSLNIKEGDLVAISLAGQQVCLTRSKSAVAKTAGMLQSKRLADSAEAMRSLTEEAIANEVITRSLDR